RASLLELAPRLRRRATLTILHVSAPVLAALEQDGSLVRTGMSAAAPYGWPKLSQTQGEQPWALDAYIPIDHLRRLQERLSGMTTTSATQPVLLRAVDGLWPFPAHCQLAPQPLAALDLLDYPDAPPRRR